MPSAHDVAALIVERGGKMTAMKLQKLAYYAQAWSTVWVGESLFGARIEAWREGPIVPELFEEHRGRHKIHAWPKGDARVVVGDRRHVVSEVVRFYGSFDGDQLSALTHREHPWSAARAEAPPSSRSKNEIRVDEFRSFYGAQDKALHLNRTFDDRYRHYVDTLLGMTPDELETLAEPVDCDVAAELRYLGTGSRA